MIPAAMGVTCKEAFQVFSANETLRLQSRVAELESRLARYEVIDNRVPLRMFKYSYEYHEELEEHLFHLFDWIEDLVKTCTDVEFGENNLGAVCDPHQLHEAISHCIYGVVGSRGFSDMQASVGVDRVSSALEAAHWVDVQHTNHGPVNLDFWCGNKVIILDLIRQSLEDWVTDMLVTTGAVDWEETDK
ncbi:hypothetical protein N9E76_00780 [bacterium]|nr:hypothetical protein [bacterium]